MALSADEKERIMQARGETSRVAAFKTRLYRPIVDGQPITMLSLSGLTLEQAEAYCRDKFGARFTGMAG